MATGYLVTSALGDRYGAGKFRVGPWRGDGYFSERDFWSNGLTWDDDEE